MERKKFMLAVLASARGATYSPVQVQKLFFLIDQNISKLVDGPYFNFIPYNYGPFDKDVYEELEELATIGSVAIHHEKNWNNYKLTESGQKLGDTLLASLPKEAQDYIKKISAFVRSLTFTQLVSAVYKAYPEMRANSVFQE